MTSADKIRAELEAAKHCDEQARQHRKRAGELLRLAGDRADVKAVAKSVGIDPRMVELLMGMG